MRYQTRKHSTVRNNPWSKGPDLPVHPSMQIVFIPGGSTEGVGVKFLDYDGTDVALTFSADEAETLAAKIGSFVKIVRDREAQEKKRREHFKALAEHVREERNKRSDQTDRRTMAAKADDAAKTRTVEYVGAGKHSGDCRCFECIPGPSSWSTGLDPWDLPGFGR